MLPKHIISRCGITFLHRGCRNFSSAKPLPDMPPCDFQPEKIQDGVTYEEALKIRRENLNPALTTYYSSPLYVQQGHMQWLWDHEHRRYLDLFGGIVTVSVGHCHPHVSQALKSQADRLWHTTNIYLHSPLHSYAKKLTEKLPGNLKVVYFVNSGSEANDLALHMARLYTGRWELVSLRNAYHGASPFMMGVTALSSWRYGTPTGLGVVNAMNPDPYVGPWGGARCRDSPVQTDRHCECGEGTCEAEDRYIDQLADVLKFSVPKSGLAAFIAESIQGVGGTVQFPRGFLRRAYDLVRGAGGVCIADEVQTGFGRTGTHFWGFEGHGVQPDIVTMAKGMGNGYPIGAVVTTPEIASKMAEAAHFNTFGGSPLAGTVGTAVLEALEADKCQENSATLGTYFLQELAKLKDRHSHIGDVRGKGLMIGVEMVADRNTRKPLPASDVLKIWDAARNYGVLLGKGGFYGNVFRIKPPMCITRADVDFAVAVMDRVLCDFESLK